MNWTSQTVETVLSYPKAVMTLKIPQGVSGQQIIDAAHAVVKKNRANLETQFVIDNYYRDDDVCLIVGRQSMDPSRDLVLSVRDAATGNPTHLINPQGGYIFLRVESCQWEGRKYAINSGDHRIVESCRHFRDELGKLLNAPSQPGE